MDFTSGKNSSENNNNNNAENANQIVDSSSSQFASDSYNVKETEERQARELKAGLHPLKVHLLKHFKNTIYLFLFLLICCLLGQFI
jgi:translation initiation factor 4E